MPFTPKDWRDHPDVTTPLSAAAMEDLETRLSGYTDSATAPVAWTAFTPSFVNLTVGNATNVGQYMDNGEFVEFYVDVTFGSTTSIAGAVAMALPTADAMPDGMLLGPARYIDGVVLYYGFLETEPSGVRLRTVATGASYSTLVSVTNIVPMTWATGDRIQGHGTYRRV